ncbi:MAG: oligosaccharide flippase family protein [Planctomycetes bacterium]|jgi:O-antigen/teichoic acid export membrane protein|nr:oligosaccharide flippase family protein [Planctomycetota bacterium]
MSKTRVYARNIAANWSGHAINLALVMVGSWYAFRALGDERFGVWSLVLSVTGYLGMVDMGLRPALYRYYNWHLGRKQYDEVAKVLSTSLAFFIMMTIVLFFAGSILAVFFHRIFPKISLELLSEVRLTVVLAACTLGITSIGAVFNSLLDSHERYDLRNIVEITTSVTKTGGVIFALSIGAGLLGMGVALVCASSLGCICGWAFSRRVARTGRARLRDVRMKTMVELLRFGVPCFFSTTGVRIVQYSHSLIIAWLIGIPAVGYYSLGKMLLEYSYSFVQRAGTVFTPRIQQSLSAGRMGELREFVPHVTRMVMGFAVLTTIGIVTLGPEFLRNFYGATVAENAGPLLPILGLGGLAGMSNQACGAVVIGAGRVSFLAVVILVQAAVDTVLALLLAGGLKLGLEGMAWAHSLPIIAISAILIPREALKVLKFDARTYVSQTAAYWMPTAGLFAMAAFLISDVPLPETWAWFFARVAASVLAFVPLFWLMIVPLHDRQRIVASVGRSVRHAWEAA